MSAVRLIFTGLIVLSMDKELPEDTKAVSAYLLEDGDLHVPELLIPRANTDDELGQQACHERDHGCAKFNEKGTYSTGECSNPAFDYYVWCLEGRDIVITQPSGAKTTFAKMREKPENDERHWKDDSPTKETGRDLSWVPEMEKVRDDGSPPRNRGVLRGDFETRITSAMEGIRGKLLPIFSMKPFPWSWSKLDYNTYSVAPGPSYYQVFAAKVAAEVALKHDKIVLKRRAGGETEHTIPLKDCKLDEKGDPLCDIYVFNRPNPNHSHDDSVTAAVDGKPACVVKHFKTYYRVLKAGPMVLPYLSGACDTWAATMNDVRFMTTSDSFCPPVIVKPGG